MQVTNKQSHPSYPSFSRQNNYRKIFFHLCSLWIVRGCSLFSPWHCFWEWVSLTAGKNIFISLAESLGILFHPFFLFSVLSLITHSRRFWWQCEWKIEKTENLTVTLFRRETKINKKIISTPYNEIWICLWMF